MPPSNRKGNTLFKSSRDSVISLGRDNGATIHWARISFDKFGDPFGIRDQIALISPEGNDLRLARALET